MQPTEILMNEHRVIEQVLECFEKILDQCAAGAPLEEPLAIKALTFFRGYADRWHHGKEEAELFPMMEANGFSGGCSPVAVMLREHELGRLYILGIEAALGPAAAGDAESLKWFVQHGRSYVKLLHEHIHKEDICLFPAANHRLTDYDQQQLLSAFEKVDAEVENRATRDACLAIADELAERFGIARAASGPPGCDTGCGHGH
jgi:hemerythrin-like domain-containing protein